MAVLNVAGQEAEGAVGRSRDTCPPLPPASAARASAARASAAPGGRGGLRA